MTTNSTHRRRRHAAKGTALVELAMCIPLLAGIIALTMFFGWAMMNHQNVESAARYSAWRMVYGWPPPPDGFDANDPNNIDDPNHHGLNDKFFRNQADHVGVGGGSGPTETLEELVQKAGEQSEAARQLADELVMYTWPKAQQASVSAHFPTEVGAWQQFQGSIRRRHIRDGHTWRRSGAGCRTAIREQYLSPLDEALQSVDSPGYELAMRIRGWYIGGW